MNLNRGFGIAIVLCSVLGANGCLFKQKAADGGAPTSTTDATPDPVPTPAFTSGQDASVVIGQPDFTSATSGYGADQLSSPNALFLSAAGVLYVSDSANGRVFGYNSLPTANGVTADFAIGQPVVSGSGGGSAIDELSYPGGIALSGSRLFIGDNANHRVMIYDHPTTTGTSADLVIGQSAPGNAIDPNAASSTVLKAPTAISIAGTKVVVADTIYSRIMLYNSIPTGGGAAAAIALGQIDLNHSGSGTGATMNYPEGVWTDGTRVVASDNFNNRVFIWNTWPTVSGQAPDLILGQADLTTHTDNFGGLSTSSLKQPKGIASDGTRLVIADLGNHRVLVWNTWPTVSNQAADLVLGQPDFTTATHGATASSSYYPTGVAMDANHILVSDANNRVLVFTKH